jgi:hypothetical protein
MAAENLAIFDARRGTFALAKTTARIVIQILPWKFASNPRGTSNPLRCENVPPHRTQAGLAPSAL